MVCAMRSIPGSGSDHRRVARPFGGEPLRKVAALSDGSRRLPGITLDYPPMQDVLGIRHGSTKRNRTLGFGVTKGSSREPPAANAESCRPTKRLPSPGGGPGAYPPRSLALLNIFIDDKA